MAEKQRQRILFVIGIIAAIPVLGICIFSQYVGMKLDQKEYRAKRGGTLQDLALLANRLERFHRDHGRFPEELEHLSWKPRYLERSKWPAEGYLSRDHFPALDWWRTRVIYRLADKGDESYTLKSLGADGKPGGSGFSEDILFHKIYQPPKWAKEWRTGTYIQRCEALRSFADMYICQGMTRSEIERYLGSGTPNKDGYVDYAVGDNDVVLSIQYPSEAKDGPFGGWTMVWGPKRTED